MLDPAITLFGRKIRIKGDNNNNGESYDFDSSLEISSFHDHHGNEANIKEVTDEESMENVEQDDSLAEAMDESTNALAMSETTDQTEKGNDSEKDSESQEEDKDSKDSDQKVQLKKPDKILPCPRCNSMDTKFCYYNNYNVNQPRHFCKSCQRYWTAGGTMRNVPVGAGRRKNKSSGSRYAHLTISEALQVARFDASNGVHHPGLKTNGTVLTFGSDSPFCEPVTSVLNIPDKAVLNVSSRKKDDRSSNSSVTTSLMENRSKKVGQEPKQQIIDGPTHQIPVFQWPYMMNPPVPIPTPFYPAVFPVPIYPHSIPWNNVPWVPHCSPPQEHTGSNPNSPTLGKHTRDGDMVTQNVNDRSSQTTTNTTAVLMPKTLRIDNPDEAAKSSIWSTLGIKKDKGDALSKVFFNSFQSKESDKKDGELEARPAFNKANPVALCRSFSFQERA